MPYYRVPARIVRVLGVWKFCEPNIPAAAHPGAGNTNARETQLAAADATSFYVWATADPVPGLTAITNAQRITDMTTIAVTHSRNVTRTLADSVKWETDLQTMRDRAAIARALELARTGR